MTWFAAALPAAAGAVDGRRPEATTQPAVREQRPAAGARSEQTRIDAFVARVLSDPSVEEAVRKTVADGWQRRRSEPDATNFLEEALAVVSADYHRALEAMSAGDPAGAAAKLRPLEESSDPYLRVHAASRLARALIEQERIEEAMAVLERWRNRRAEVERYSFQGPDMDFTRAYGLLRELKYDRAAAAFEEFLGDHPEAPERLRLSARQILQELRQRRPDGLGDVADLMGYAGRRMRAGRPDDPAIEAQRRAIDLLDRLIKDKEQQEQQASQGTQSSRSESSRGRPREEPTRSPAEPATNSAPPQGAAQPGPLRRSPVARPGEVWGRMPARDRERVLQSLRKNFPARYRELVEQYYRQLGKEP